ncbi:MAG TPA: hypothetical protein P5250_06795 [Bacteroidales bacterium]|nr:hypothetical protein [Bacteroidales bacterium]
MKKVSIKVFLLIVLIIINSCGIFHKGKKKDCGDCPTWSYNINDTIKIKKYGHF